MTRKCNTETPPSPLIPPTPPFTEEQGKMLLKLARRAIADRLGLPISDMDNEQNATDGMDETDTQEDFEIKLGTFVTIHLNGALRGCIGTLEPTESVWEGIERNALNAAFHDPRFSELTVDEFPHIHLEISILSKSLPLDYTDGEDLIAQLDPDVHGVIIKKRGARATFLPQVWQQLPDRKMFLSQLCLKAGLPKDEWNRKGVEVMTYTVQYFEE